MAQIKNGVDNISSYRNLFEGKRLGLITSIAGVDAGLHSSVDILHEAFGLTALFSPEHGVRGDREAGETVDTYTDAETGLPVYSLYRKDSKRFTPEMLDAVDAVVYDIQDVGVRFYTFISTLLYALEDCAKAGKELIILDRVNPLGGDVTEGNILDMNFSSFVGAYPLPVRHGLTVGEFAAMANGQQSIGCKLTVVPCSGWRRGQMFHDTGLFWVMPSLGLPRAESAYIYPGHCLFEGTNLSEGRGTSCPFELIGAPFVNGAKLAKAMNAKNLPGVIYTAAYFTPTSSKHNGTACQGVHAHITDPYALRPATAGVELLYTVREMYPDDFEFLAPYREGGHRFIELLGGGSLLVEKTKDEVLQIYVDDSARFKEAAVPYLLYK